MNILILNWRDPMHPKSGGAEIVTMNHAKAWVRAGHRVTWLTSSYKNAAPEERYEGVSIIRKFGSLTIYLYAPWFLLFRAHNFDVFVDEVHGIPFFSPIFTRKPVVAFIHEIAGEIWDFMYPFPVNSIGRMLESLYLWVYKDCLFWTDAPSTITELVKRGIPLGKCTAIPCPITIENENKKIAVPKDKVPTYIFVSRVVRMKGIEEVVKAFSFIIKEQPEARLWIVGGGDTGYIDQLKRMMNDYGVLANVKFFGQVTESKKLSLMARSHILLHASVKEGWGLVVLEAAYMGTPSVVYNVTGLCDVVKNGQTGVVLKSNLPHEMATEAVKLYMDSERYAVFQKNGKIWTSSLKWSDVVRTSLVLLQKAIQKK